MTAATKKRKLRIAIIGAGASGLMALIRLREAGIEDVTVFEKAKDLGGTWLYNRYPGLTCDVPSHAYRYSFAPNPDWSQVYAPSAEIHAYLKNVAQEHDAERFIQYEREVTAARFEGGLWHVETNAGPEGAFDAVISAVGILHHPRIPDIPGLESFAGKAMHTSRWEEGLSLKGKRLGIIGTGSTATQITAATIGEVSQLTLFQRTAQWMIPLPNLPIPEEQRADYHARPEKLEEEFKALTYDATVKFARAIIGENPGAYAALEAGCKEYLATVKDPELRARLTPDYPVGCKRLIVNDRFYEAIQQPHAELVTDGIERIEPDGVRTKDGRLHELDVLALATGFDTHSFHRPMRVEGPEGRSLDETWKQANEGYKSVTVPGYPNWFMIGGPNSPIGNFSWLLTAEAQFGYILKLVELLRDGAATHIAPKREAARAFNEEVKRAMPKTVWAQGCDSWYIDKNGNVASWPWSYDRFAEEMRAPVLEDYELA